MDSRDAVIKGPYNQRSIRARIEAFFLDNLGRVATREQIIQVATDPVTGRQPENWHQRLSELRTDMDTRSFLGVTAEISKSVNT